MNIGSENNLRIGVTNAGDAGIDLSWVQKLSSVDGAILTTKKITDEFIEQVLHNQQKLIVQATCTGYGGTVLEPNIPVYTEQLNMVRKLISAGFPANKVVVRIDPIIPTLDGIDKVKCIVTDIKDVVQRFRVSILDMYPQVREKFLVSGLELPYGDCFSPSKQQVKLVNDCLLSIIQTDDVVVECCNESKLHSCQHVGCVSSKDMTLLKLPWIEENNGYSTEQIGCLCLSCKQELLGKQKCANNCVYCYL